MGKADDDEVSRGALSSDRVVAVVATLDTGYVQIGSGYLLTDRAVITADHCVRDKKTGRPPVEVRIVRRSDGATARTRKLFAALDIAVLALDDKPLPGAGPLNPPRFGRVDRTRAGELLDCQAIGFPFWQLDPHEQQRNAAELHGIIRLTEGAETGILVMRDSLLNDVGVPATVASGDRGPQSPWGGLSGALVFHAGLGLGVIIEHHPWQGGAALTVQSVERVAEFAERGDRDALNVAMTLGILPSRSLAVAGAPWHGEKTPVPGDDARIDQVAAGYARWMANAHSMLVATIAGKEVTAPAASAPVPDRFFPDETGQFERYNEVGHLALHRAGGLTDEQVTALFPVPTHLGPSRHPDEVEFGGKPAKRIGDLLADEWRMVIAGDPGSGKTTLARVIAREAALKFTGFGGESASRLPVLVRAAEYDTTLARLAAESPDAVLRFEHVAIAAGWKNEPPHDPASKDPFSTARLMQLADAAFAEGRMLLIVDGLDEVPDLAQRRKLVALLRDFEDRAGSRMATPGVEPGNQIMVTTRFTGYHAAPLDQRFSPYVVMPLTPQTGRAVADYWANAAGSAYAGARQALSAAFGDLASRDEPIAGNPFLLVSLVSAVVAGQRSGGRSWTRSDLYRVMLQDAVRRCAERRPEAPVSDLADFQCAFAYLFHQESRTGLMAADDPALDAVITAAAAACGLDGVPIASLAAWLEAMGLLADRGQGVKGFMHLTIQEYLVGVWLVRDAAELVRIIASDDPCWAEPIRLGVADLARTRPAVFARRLDALLDGGAAVQFAAVLSPRLDEIEDLTGDQVGRMLAAIFQDVIPSAEASALTGDAMAVLDDVAATAEAMIASLLRAPSDYGWEREDAVTRLLVGLLAGDSEFAIAFAARLIERLVLFDPSIARALLDAQVRESGRYGWQTVRALQAVASAEASAPVADRDAATEQAVGRLTDQELETLTRMRLRLSELSGDTGPQPPRPHCGLTRPALLRAEWLPLRSQLLADPSLGALIAQDMGWARIVTCLYGGVPFADIARRRRDIVAWRRIHDSPTVTESRRRRAGQVLDALAEGDRAARARPGFSVESITVDSPLTGRLLDWLRDGESSAQVAAGCLAIAMNPAEEPAARGDALIAWAASGIAPPDQVHAELAATAGTPVGSRLRWRLARAEFLLKDRLSTDADEEGITAVVAAAGKNPAAAWGAVLRTLLELDAHRRLPPDGDLGARRTAPLGYLLSMMTAPSGDPAYVIAVALDTAGREIVAGGGEGLVAALCRLPSIVGDSADWRLDPLAPADVADMGAALRVVAGLGDQWHLPRSWLLDRLADEAIEEGFGGGLFILLSEGVSTGSLAAWSVMKRLLRHSTTGSARVRSTVSEPGLPPEPEEWTPAAALAYENAVAIGLVQPDPARLLSVATRWPSPRDRARALLRAVRMLPEEDHAELLAAAIIHLDALGGADSPENAALLVASGAPGVTRLLRERGTGRLALGPALWDQLWDLEAAAADPLGALGRDRAAQPGAEQNSGRPGPAGSGPDVAEAFGGLPAGYGEAWRLARGLVAWARDGGPLPSLDREGDPHEGAERLSALLVGQAVLSPGERELLLAASARLRAAADEPQATDWWPDPYPACPLPELTALDNLLGIPAPAARALAIPMITLLLPDFVAAGLAPALLEAADPADRRKLFHQIRALADNDEYRRALTDLFCVLDAAAPCLDELRGSMAADLVIYGPASAVVVAVPGGIVARIDGGSAEYQLHHHLRALRRAGTAWWSAHAGDIDQVLESLDSRQRVRWIEWLVPYVTQHQGLELLDAAARVASADAEVTAAIAALRRRVAGASLQSMGWSVLTAAAFCHDARLTVESCHAADDNGIAVAAWNALPSTPDPASALRRLRMSLGADTFLLDNGHLNLAVELLGAGEIAVVCELLSLGRIRQQSRTLDLLRHNPVTEVGDLATLLLIEIGVLDAPGVPALTRLLGDNDERIRVRARLAATGRQSGSKRRALNSTDIGTDGMRALISAYVAAHQQEPRIATDLWWTLLGIYHSRLDPLLTAIAEAPASYRAALLRTAWLLSDDACKQYASQVANASGDDAHGLLWGLADTKRIHMLAEDTRAEVHTALDAVRGGTDIVLAAKATRLLGLWAEPAQALIAELSALALPAPSQRQRPGPVAIGACEALGGLAARLPMGELRDEIAQRLAGAVTHARGTHRVAVLTALCRTGHRIERLVVNGVRSQAILRALAYQAPETVENDESRAAYTRAAKFVLRPPLLGGDDAEAHSTWLLDMIAEALTSTNEAPRYRWEPDMALRAEDCLGILGEVARQHPATARVLAARHPALVSALARTTTTARSWMAREHAAKALVLLGTADADVVRAILSAATDNHPVQGIVLEHLDWLFRFTDDGFDVIESAVSGSPRDAAAAILRMVGALAAKGIFSATQHRRAIKLVREIAHRPDAEIPVMIEAIGGAAMAIGSLASQAAETLRELRQLSGIDTAETAPAGMLEVPEADDRPDNDPIIFAVPAAGSVDVPFKQQHIDSKRRLSTESLTALSAAARAAAAEQIGLIDVLKRTCTVASTTEER
jgi:hypothetical protein